MKKVKNVDKVYNLDEAIAMREELSYASRSRRTIVSRTGSRMQSNREI